MSILQKNLFIHVISWVTLLSHWGWAQGFQGASETVGTALWDKAYIGKLSVLRTGNVFGMDKNQPHTVDAAGFMPWEKAQKIVEAIRDDMLRTSAQGFDSKEGDWSFLGCSSVPGIFDLHLLSGLFAGNPKVLSNCGKLLTTLPKNFQLEFTIVGDATHGMFQQVKLTTHIFNSQVVARSNVRLAPLVSVQMRLDSWGAATQSIANIPTDRYFTREMAKELFTLTGMDPLPDLPMMGLAAVLPNVAGPESAYGGLPDDLVQLSRRWAFRQHSKQIVFLVGQAVFLYFTIYADLPRSLASLRSLASHKAMLWHEFLNVVPPMAIMTSNVMHLAQFEQSLRLMPPGQVQQAFQAWIGFLKQIFDATYGLQSLTPEAGIVGGIQNPYMAGLFAVLTRLFGPFGPLAENARKKARKVGF